MSGPRLAGLLAALAAFLPACSVEEDAHLDWRRRQELLRENARQDARRERELCDRIAAEIRQRPDHPWAGSYRVSELATSAVYHIAPDSGVALSTRTCAGWSRPCFGTIVASDERTIHVEWQDEEYRRLPSKLYAVRWGDVRFLVPAAEMAGFCRRVEPLPAPALGPEWGKYPRDTEDLTSCVVLPDLPEPYRSRLERRLYGG